MRGGKGECRARSAAQRGGKASAASGRLHTEEERGPPALVIAVKTSMSRLRCLHSQSAARFTVVEGRHLNHTATSAGSGKVGCQTTTFTGRVDCQTTTFGSLSETG